MKELEDGCPVEYLGYGVYAVYDGYGIDLRANDHMNPTDRVYIEPAVLKALIQFSVDAHEHIKNRGDLWPKK